MGSLNKFVSTSGRATSKASPIYPLVKNNHEKVFNSISSVNLFDKLQEARKATGTQQLAHCLKFAAIKFNDSKESILQVGINDNCSSISNKARNEIAAAMETQPNMSTWDKMKPFLKTALPWTENSPNNLNPASNASDNSSNVTLPLTISLLLQGTFLSK